MQLIEVPPSMWPSALLLLLVVAAGLAAWRGRLDRRKAILVAAPAAVALVVSLFADRGVMMVSAGWSAAEVQNQLGATALPYSAQEIVDARAQAFRALPAALVGAWAEERGLREPSFWERDIRVVATDRSVQLTSSVSLAKYLVSPRTLMERSDFANWLLHPACQRNLTMVQLHKADRNPSAASGGLITGDCYRWANATLSPLFPVR
jgi:hypothetical protein